MTDRRLIQSAREAVDVLGRDAIAAAVGVSPLTVANRQTGKLPGWWAAPLMRLARERGVDLDTDVFQLRRGASPEAAA